MMSTWYDAISETRIQAFQSPKIELTYGGIFFSIIVNHDLTGLGESLGD